MPSPAPFDKYLELSSDDTAAFKADEVVLFSGGLVSLSGAVEELAASTKKVALVSHQSSSKIFDFRSSSFRSTKFKVPSVCSTNMSPM